MKFDMKLYEKAVINVRAKIVRGQLGENVLYKKAADSYARMFDIHQEIQAVSKQMQELEAKQQNLINETMRLQGGMEVIEGVLAEELINSGVQLEDLDMKQVSQIAQDAIKSKTEAKTEEKVEDNVVKMPLVEEVKKDE